jgi:hypothetical protein
VTAALVGLTVATTPEGVHQDLVRALGVLVHRAAGHGRDAPCESCRALGERLAVPVGRALFTAHGPAASGTRTERHYLAIGRALELLEREAGTLRPRPIAAQVRRRG